MTLPQNPDFQRKLVGSVPPLVVSPESTITQAPRGVGSSSHLYLSGLQNATDPASVCFRAGFVDGIQDFMGTMTTRCDPDPGCFSDGTAAVRPLDGAPCHSPGPV
jgi:hypothetical protein